MPEATEYYNHKTCEGELSEGCKQCVLGQKLVLFVTGVCGNGCSYCPVSDAKNHHDVTFANEWKIESDEDLFEEARLMNAKGAGITGGDPLAVVDRSTHYIKILKEKYGKHFHIHLYTPLLRVNEDILTKLYESGLDEIRFHPKLDDKKEWPRLKLAKKYDWKVGIEVPAIPEHEEGLRDMMSYLAKEIKPDFVNLNEFEYADNQVFEESGKRYEPKNQLSYGVKGSEETALRLLELGEKLGLAIHYCTAKSKDSVQLATRIKRRAEKAAKIYDAVDEEGLLSRGALYATKNIPSVQELQEMNTKEKEKYLRYLEDVQEKLLTEWDVPEELLEIDTERLRILTTTSVAEEAAKTLNMTVALVKEYPTKDCFQVEAELLCEHNGNKN